MKFAFYIAKRYLFAKKNTNAINIISSISALGIIICSAALFIILSVFNGFETLVLSLYDKFTPDIKIESKIGKTFNPNDSTINLLKKDDIAYFIECIEDKALLRFEKNQYIATIKGVSSEFINSGSLDSNIVYGALDLGTTRNPFAIVGAGVEYYLGLNINSSKPIVMFAPRKDLSNSFSIGQELNQKIIYPSGIFQVQADFDSKYVIVPISFARELFSEKQDVSYIEIILNKDINIYDFQEYCKNTLGNSYSVKNKFEQNELLYKVLNSEKWAVYAILTMVLVIAICNIIGSLIMLVIDKKKDIAILLSLGASEKTIKLIFGIEGMLISLYGTILGLLLGLSICFLQIKFGLIKLNQSAGTFVIENYPVEMRFIDVILVFSTVMIISLIASIIAANISIAKNRNIKEELLEE